VGAIAGPAYTLPQCSLIDWTMVLISALTLIIMTGARKVPGPLLILAAGAVGIVLRGGLR